MTPERWKIIKDALATALELPWEERSGYLDKTCGDDDQLRREIELLLEHERQTGQFLSETSLAEVTAALLPEEDNPWIGRRIGAYQIVKQIGAGGMGEVYLAFRADDQYRQEVALKLIRAGQDLSLVVARFKNERQILATLEHPNIARLLDGGTTETGTPYLVMERIEGQPIGEYCDAHKLSIADRLNLFIQVCAAVQYAHQRLIIHRDIKPNNILVAEDGTPKLLDFGVAKVVGSDMPAQQKETLTAFRALTPEYASPEQINGSPVTTASDIYSLGVVLYQLLAGRSPYFSTIRPQELAAAICEQEPEKPSAAIAKLPAAGDAAAATMVEQMAGFRGSSPRKLQKELSGDLDNIVLMALRKEPARRYASAEQFAADIRRYLEQVPVLAREDTTAYRVSKFVTRHKAGVMTSAVVALAILASLALALHEARVARQQAEIARAQRLRAERRFNDVRALANSLMFEIHDSIKDLPGATRARSLVVTRALEYLDQLSQESGGDAALQRELAAAYDRVGDVLGYEGQANLGDFSGAIKSYNKALAIREASAAANPGDVQIQTDLFNNYFRLSFALQSAGDYAGALNDVNKALPIAQRLASASDDPRYQDWLAGVHWQTANILSRSAEYSKALDEYRAAAAIREALMRRPGANKLSLHLPSDYTGIGQMLWRTGDVESALQISKKALQMVEDQSKANPNDATLREYLGEIYSFLQPILLQHGNVDESLECGRKAHQIFESLVVRDRTNQLAMSNLGFTDIEIGETLIRKGKISDALPYIRHAMELFESRKQKTRYDVAGQAQSYSTLGLAHEALADRESSPLKKGAHLREARTWLRKSAQTWLEDPNHGSPDPTGGHEGDRVREELAKCESGLAKL